MPGENYQSWSVTAANNGNADTSIEWREGQTRASVNNSSRSEMAAHAKNRNLLNGSIVTGGTANAQTFTSGVGYIAPIPTGLLVKLKIGAGLTNDGPASLNMDGIGDTVIKTADGQNTKGGELVGGSYTDLVFDGTSWIFLYSREFFFELITGGDGIICGQQIFATAGSFEYIPTPLMECCIVECVGGGGGGGGGSGGADVVGNGGGGGSGSYSRKLLTAADVGASQPVVVGDAGLGQTGAPGSDGSPTTFGSLCAANGGAGGGGFGQPGGVGGGAGLGDVAAAGSPGEAGSYNPIGGIDNKFIFSGAGGSGPWGGGAPASIAPPSFHVGGATASNYGSGGGGASTYDFGAAIGGGDGSAGVVIITEFRGRGSAGRDGVDGAPGAPGATGPIGPVGPSGPGTGDVLRSGTPVVGQIAQWVDASHIKGVDFASDFSTGDAKITLKTVADPTWVMMNDGTIGSATSGASTRANIDTNALFVLLFNNITDAFAPIFTSAGVATTRAAQTNAAAAWAANCRMSLTKQLGRALGVAGSGASLTARSLGATAGEEAHVLITTEMPSHNHVVNDPGHVHGIQTVPYVPSILSVDPGAYQNVPVYGGNVLATSSAVTGITTANRGSGTAHNVVQPTTFWNVMIKL